MMKSEPEAQPPTETRFESISSLCCTLVTGLFVLTFVFQNFAIPSASMASTLLIGDHVVVDRASLAPSTSWAHFLPYRAIRRGEPIVFYKPILEDDGTELILVKRVIGVPGDRIHLRDGVVYLNGIAQIEAQAAKPTALDYDSYRDDFPSIPPDNVPGVTATWTLNLPTHIEGPDLVVPADSYFVMGDNRTKSLDGRYWGFVPRRNLIGRPLFVYWSYKTPADQINKTSLADQASFALHQFTHFVQETRWRRMLHPIS
ncbi:MAG TPA: signal peptidase I [Acidobacteriaceae bacterium]